MKKMTWMLMGALGATAAMAYMNKTSIERSIKKMKKNSTEAFNKVKAIFD